LTLKMKAIPPFETLTNIDPKRCNIAEDPNHEQHRNEDFRSHKVNLLSVCDYEGTAVALCFCATNRKVAGSIPDGVMEFFIDINPSDRTMALESTQLLTEMSISWG
jgi:hypothetical protein